MPIFRTLRLSLRPVLLSLIALAGAQHGSPQATIGAAPRFPYAEKLVYRVGWRMVTAGEANLKLTQWTTTAWQLDLQVASSGFVNQLYRVLDSYKLVDQRQVLRGQRQS